MKHLSTIIASLSLCLATSIYSCSSESTGEDVKIPTGQEQHASITNDDAHWTYYSLESGEQVGISVFGDSIADKQWSQRTDWDIAISGDLIRTNSGASGNAQGGILEIDGTYESVKTAPTNGYFTDTYE